MNESVHFFLIVLFWLYLAGIVLKALLMAVSNYPRTQQFSVGMDAFSLIFGGAWVFWISWLLWGAN